MSETLFKVIGFILEPPTQPAVLVATRSILNVTVPRLISHGGTYTLVASVPTSNVNATNNNNNNTSSSAATATSSSSNAQKSHLAYRGLLEGFSNFVFRFTDTSEFCTRLHFRLARAGDAKVMEANIKAAVDRAPYAKIIEFQQGAMKGIDLSKCFENAKMIEEVHFKVAPTPENIIELGRVAPRLRHLYVSRADLITSDAMIQFCEGRRALFERSTLDDPVSLHRLLLWVCPHINVAAIKAIATLPALEILSIRSCPALAGKSGDLDAVNEAVGAIAQIPRLRDLDLEVHLTDKGLKLLGDGLPLLQKLYFYSCNGSKECSVDKGFYHLFKGLHRLREFSISEMPAEALEELAYCKTLRVLKLYDCPVKDRDFVFLKNLPNLEVVQLSHCDEFVLPTANNNNDGQEEEEGENNNNNNQQEEHVGEENETGGMKQRPSSLIPGFSHLGGLDQAAARSFSKTNSESEDLDRVDDNVDDKNGKNPQTATATNTLTRLCLNYCRGITSEIYNVIATSFPNLKELQIFTSEAPVQDEHLEALGTKLSRLEDLLLMECQGVTKKGLKHLGKRNLKNLRALSLSKLPKPLNEEEVMWRVIENEAE